MTNSLISRDALLKELDISPDEWAKGRTISAIIANAPAVDAAPVVHGRWEWEDDGYCRCSNCKQKAPVTTQYQDEPMTTMTNYCPNCGAMMRGECDETEQIRRLR